MKKTTLIEDGKWYKGNLHCHSTVSDGELDYRTLIKEYKNRGYSFLCLSEHNKYTNYENENTNDFITIPGFEGNIDMPDEDWRVFHYNAFLGTDKMVSEAKKPQYKHMEDIPVSAYENEETIKNVIDDLVDRGYMVMFNHPHWSTVELEDIINLKNIFGVEVYNHCSEWLENMGESNIIWESMLRRGKRIYGTATDDNHNRFDINGVMCDSFGGFIVVKAEELTRNSIMESIEKGSFYASTGPEIEEFYIEDNIVHFKCSPVQRIYLNGCRRQIQIKISQNNADDLTEFSAPLQGTEKFVRIECIDSKGKKAYTNAIFID